MAALTATLSACTGAGHPEGAPSDPLTRITVDCDEFADTTERITNAQTALYSNTGDSQALEALEHELQALEKGAPSDVRTALGDMTQGFEQARSLLESPTRRNKARLRDLIPKLARDSRKITAYITSECAD